MPPPPYAYPTARPPSPGLFSYLKLPAPHGGGPYEANARFLRFAGILVLVGAGLAVLEAILTLAFAGALAEHGPGGEALGSMVAGGAIVMLVIGLAIYAGASFWVSYTYFHWLHRDRRGYGNCLGIGIVMIVLGGLGALDGLSELSYLGAGGAGALVGLTSLLALAVSVLILVFGILLLVNRGKPETMHAFGIAPPQAPPMGYQQQPYQAYPPPYPPQQPPYQQPYQPPQQPPYQPPYQPPQQPPYPPHR